MQQQRLGRTTAAAIVALGLGFHAPADAVVRDMFANLTPASTCQLSIPSTDTKVRPKAIGYRNEGTTNSFVICGYPKPNQDSYLTFVNIGVASFDGQAHTFNCTTATGVFGNSNILYSTKAVTAPATGSQFFPWGPEDFLSTGTIPESWAMTVTCTLPPNVSIVYLQYGYKLDVGA